MPTHPIVALLQASPPRRAVAVLLALPKDRINRLLTVIDGRLLARMLIAAEPDRRAALLGHLNDARLAAELALLPMAEAAAVLAALPPDRAAAQLDRVLSEHLSTLLDTMPAPERLRLIDVMDPLRLADLRRVDYEKSVIGALRSTSASLSWVPDDHGSNLLAGVMRRLFGVALCYVDDGVLSSAPVLAARQVFAGERVYGLLIVSNAEPSPEAAELVRGGRELPALVATWDPADTEGVLARALVRLAG